MYRVIDTISQRRDLHERHPDLPFDGEGVLAILDPARVRAPFPPVVRVRLTKPDGTEQVVAVGKVRVGAAGVVALFFPDTLASAIPRGTLVEVVE